MTSSTQSTEPKFDIKVKLTGRDGNAFSIMGNVSNALKKAGATSEQLAQYRAESTAGDYSNLLRVAGDWVHIS
jgi:hypothetical protein